MITTMCEKRTKALSVARRESKPQIGKMLANGGTILAFKDHKSSDWGDTYIVLCLVPHSHQPFVSWKLYTGVQQMADGDYKTMPPYCVYGQYAQRLDEAIECYEDRDS